MCTSKSIRRAPWAVAAIGLLLLDLGCGGRTEPASDTEAMWPTQGGSMPASSQSGGTAPTQQGGSNAKSSNATESGTGGLATGSRSSGVGGQLALGGSGMGARPSTVGGHAALGGWGGLTSTATDGTAFQGCPDNWAFNEKSLTITGELANFANRYEPSCTHRKLVSDYVLVWVAPETGTYVVSTLGSESDTSLAIYSGVCGQQELHCSDDDAFVSRQSRVTLQANESEIYTIVVDGPPGAFKLSVNRAAALIDSFLDNVVPSGVNGSTLDRSDTATSTCNGSTSSADATYLWKAPSRGSYRFEISKASFDAVLSLRSGGPAGEELACDRSLLGENPSLVFALDAGEAVAIVVDGMLGATGDFDLRITRDVDTGDCCTVAVERKGCVAPTIRQCVCDTLRECCADSWRMQCAESLGRLGCADACTTIL